MGPLGGALRLAVLDGVGVDGVDGVREVVFVAAGVFEEAGF